MADLLNSHRRIPKATYVPLSLSTEAQTKSGRAVEKAAFVRSLQLRPTEIQALVKTKELENATVKLPDSQRTKALTTVVREFSADKSGEALKRFGPLLARTRFEDLIALGNATAHLRRAAATVAKEAEDQAKRTNVTDPQSANFSVKENAATAQKAKGPPVNKNSSRSVALLKSADDVDAVVKHLQYRVPVTPVGRIHLERMEMTPVGVEHGELVHSVPMGPAETVNISHREWSATTSTFETLTTQGLEGFSETGVAEKSDLAEASNVEVKHTSSLDVSGSVSASYNGGAYSLTASAAVDSASKTETDNSDKRSVAHSMAITRSASTRTKQEHKTSFVVSSVAGAENMSVQVLTNPSSSQAMRVDYYQLLRKWRVDLIRYGLRMTYDIAVPNPGIDLISKVLELKQMTQTLLGGYAFSLDPASIDPANWQTLEDQYSTVLDAPPAAQIGLMQAATVPGQTYDKWGSTTISFDVPEGYYIASAKFRGFFSVYATDGHHLNVNIFGEPNGTTNTASGEFQGHDTPLQLDLSDATLLHKTGSVFLVVDYHNVDFGEMQVNVVASPTDETISVWRNKVWAQLKAADQNNYNLQLTLIRDRKAQLEGEIAKFDALTLRKMEREEIMKAVLTWLIGPPFQMVPDDIAAIVKNPDIDKGAISGNYRFPEVDQMSDPDYRAVIQHGEVIKFLHNAIEWENVLFFAYPYFWDRAENWEFKRFLMHDDYNHREFLRAGAARVVIPVRPGFETSFAMFMESGDATLDPDMSFPYVSIGQETRNFAMTNYEGIPPANPDWNVRTLLYPSQTTAWTDIQNIIAALSQYFTDHGKYPSALSDADLAAAAQKIGIVLNLNDPWGASYDYTCPGIFGDFDLLTKGTTSHPEIDGLDGIISNYAEGSVVGRWYEYTPTSALDIAVSMIPFDKSPIKTVPDPA